MLLTDILRPGRVKVPIEAKSKQDAIRELVELLCDDACITCNRELMDAVWQRETTRTTGIGRGIAIPHGKCAAIKTLSMAVAKPATPIEFGAIDGKPVDLLILLASPLDQTGPHIHALASISRMLTDDTIRAAIKHAETADEVYRVIEEHESRARV